MKIKNRKRAPKKTVILIVVILATLTGGALYWWFILRNPGPVTPEKTTEQTRSEKIHSKSRDTNKNNTENTTETAPNSAIGSSKEPAASTPPSSSATPPETPSGTFVSNHFVSLTSYTSQNSVCHTSPGAKCTITFSQGSTTRSLPVKQTDANGNTSWDWDVKELGLTTGIWTITVKAANEKHASTTVDQINLEVK